MIYPFSGISKRRQEKGLVKASVSRQRDAVECTHRATYTHTNRVSVLGLRLWLLWVFSWEITVNKIRREEFCLYVNVCLWECVSNSSTFSSPLSSINADQSVPIFICCTYERLHALGSWIYSLYKSYHVLMFIGASTQ